jgi:hypothetical protein
VAAVPYATVSDFLDDLRFQCDALDVGEGISNYIELYKILYPDIVAITILPRERVGILRKLTGCTVALDPDLNCYPRGEAEVICFDLDGEEVP